MFGVDSVGGVAFEEKLLYRRRFAEDAEEEEEEEQCHANQRREHDGSDHERRVKRRGRLGERA